MLNPRLAIITGDVTIDWNLARSPVTTRKGAMWDPDFTSRCYRQKGGAALLGEIIKAAADPLGHTIIPVDVSEGEGISPGCEGVSHSYTICTQYPGEKDDSPPIWRVKEFLGVDEAPKKPSPDPLLKPKPPATWLDDRSGADLIIIDDAGQGFRNLPKDKWPLSFQEPGSDTWIILKLAHPELEKGELLKHVEEKFAGRIVLVLTVNDLRAKKLRITRELSWESAVEDLIKEFQKKPEWLPNAYKCVVSFYTEGAVILPDWNKPGDDAQLIYDPHSVESAWDRAHPGKMFGYTQCLTAGIALSFLNNDNFDSIGKGVRWGLETSRYLHKIGFETSEFEHRTLPLELKFPTEKIGEFLRDESVKPSVEPGKEEEKGEFSERTVPCEMKPGWSILQLQYSDAEEVMDLAIEIVEMGHEDALRDVPYAKFDNFIPLELAEIEGIRQIQTLMGEYHRSTSEKKPLSIAVFGSPGSGKSFAVESVAKSLSKDGIEIKQFNLSQFSGPTDLLGAFHQIRDEALKGKMPLVFWDEFDSRLGMHDLGWLRYFLSPMQDGTFQHGELTHPIGKAIFVFAGGTSAKLDEFEQETEKNLMAKGKDFLSRLKGFAHIPGLDHSPGRLDPNVVVRRAMILRANLLKFAPDIVQKKRKSEEIRIDGGVLNAFMVVEKYKHGIRSLESIIRMSFLTGKSLFDRSSLPAKAQLSLHVEPEEFIRYLDSAPDIRPSLRWNDS